MAYWRGFAKGNWTENIDVSDFIKRNYTPYTGDASFLKGATKRTKRVAERVRELLALENEKGGVLEVDAEHVSSLLSHAPGYVLKDDDIIVGLQTDEPLKRAVNPFAGYRNAVQACKAYGYEIGENVTNEFKYRTTHNTGVFRAYTDTMKKARHVGILTGLPDAYARGRIIGDYRRIALYGMDYLIKQREQDKKKIGERDMCEDTIQLLEDIEKQLEFMKQLVVMAGQYGCDIMRPANNALEAIQWLYFGYLGAVKEQNGAANSIGRISAFIDIYVQRDIEEGVLDEISAQELVDDLVIKMRLVRHLRTPEYNDLFAGDPVWVTCSLAGMTEDGRPMVTKTCFRFLQTLYNLGPSAEPNLTVLWAQELPEGFKRFCAKVSIDTDSIQYENDDVMRKDYGDDYAIACCVSAMKTGKQMQFFGARCNLAKVLLMALNGGKDEVYGEQIAPDGKVYEDGKVLVFEEVLESFKEYAAWMAKLYVNTMNVIHYMHDRYAYERLMMSLHDVEPERLMAFGISGLSVLADSLSAIKYAKVTPVKDERGIIVDFETEGDFPKYGNDDDRADEIAKWITEFFYGELCKTKTYRNAKHTLSILTITSNVVYGKKTGATPDGRKAGEPFAPGANPMHGRDSEGALASLNSVAKLCFDCCQDGISNTFSITPETLGTDDEDRTDKLVAVLDGYFLQKAHHLNVNVLNRQKLIDAMNNPALYPSLTIRVSGYAVNFNKLTRDKQLEVISRTFHEKM
ncbi:MAG: formate C-acetyltransferase [Clostridia bacterium]|nr:formate C-acetyltransferase [Oscillospiraceae bacterium]MBQ7960756.1 formate C-acetyltransferase [Clostridia bacterium]